MALKCIICGNKKFEEIHLYTTPDRYEKYMGIENVERDWSRCMKCGHCQQWRNYPLGDLEGIYENGYRSLDFRGETIQQAYNKVMAIPNNENSQRCEWFIENIGDAKTVLDIGSGLGVFPKYLSNRDYSVDCVEVNTDSNGFIQYNLKLPCYFEIPDRNYDVVTLVHVLEHIDKPKDFLSALNTEKVFIEVPDAVEFELLEKNHDEFNSCHCHFFTAESLGKLLSICGYEIMAEHDVHYKSRNLSRLMVIAAKE
jgi:predicted nucleic-acid-binding Zn-ribbon protein